MKRVLIVIDMQEDFVRGSLGSKDAEAIVSKVKAKITEYMERGDKIIFTRDTHRENYLETLEGKNLPVEHCIYGTEGWRIIPELVDDCKEYPDCSFIDKVTFGYENWKDIFGTVDEYSIELVGLCTDICVVSNALALRMFYPSWNISVDESCCAGVTTKKHKAALEVMKSCQIEVTNSQKTK
jgi:nicotinamidase-related amidase